MNIKQKYTLMEGLFSSHGMEEIWKIKTNSHFIIYY